MAEWLSKDRPTTILGCSIPGSSGLLRRRPTPILRCTVRVSLALFRPMVLLLLLLARLSVYITII